MYSLHSVTAKSAIEKLSENGGIKLLFEKRKTGKKLKMVEGS